MLFIEKLETNISDATSVIELKKAWISKTYPKLGSRSGTFA